MAKPAKGDPQKDVDVLAYVKSGKQFFSASMLRNYDQKTLRSVRCALAHIAADVNRYLDVRNEQGRGGKRIKKLTVQK